MVLWILTLVSVAAAVACAWFAWRLQRDERDRSNARVAALADAIDHASDVDRIAHGDTVSIRGQVPVASLFETDTPSAVRGRPLLKVAIGFAMAVIVVIAVASISDRHDEPSSRAVSRTDTSPSLELLSMRHERDGETLTVIGFVRNAGRTQDERLIAVVFAFDRAGNFLASGRAALENDRLKPGDESPFRVDIPNAAGVGRYRVTFRNDLGVVRHVDRRPGPIASSLRLQAD